MKRFLICFAVIALLPCVAFAGEFDKEQYEEYLSSYDYSFFEDTLDRETLESLAQLGADSFSYQSLSGLSFSEVFRLVLSQLKERAKAPAEGFASVFIFVLLSAFFKSLNNEASQMSEAYSTASAVIISLLLIVKISPCVTLAASSVSVSADFVYAFVPVFAAIVASGGGITTSFSTNSMLLVLSQGLGFVSSNVLMPCVNCFLAVGICSSLKADIGLDRLTSSLKRLFISLLSFVSGAYVSILSLKTTISSRADLLGIRSVRFVINSVVPVVGGALSEGLLSIQSYSSLIKSSVGLVGIIATALVFLPAVTETALWQAVLSFSLIASEVFGDNSVASLLRAFRDAVLLLNVILIICALTTVVSIGILIAARTA